MKKTTKRNFVHLHNHTQYSLMKGISRVRALVEHAVKLEMKHIAITDHSNMSGVPIFLMNCEAYGINPIVGCELQIKKDSNEYTNLVLLVKNYEGYKNLIKLSSYGYIKTEKHKPVVGIEYLRTHSHGLICLSAGIKGEISSFLLSGDTEKAEKAALEYQEIIGKDNFYLEVEDHGTPEEKVVNKHIVQLSKKTGIPIVAANNTYYLNKEDAEAQYVQRCLANVQKYDEQYKDQPGYSEYYIKSREDMVSVFSDMPEALSNTLIIAEKCNLMNDLLEHEFPDNLLSTQMGIKNIEQYDQEYVCNTVKFTFRDTKSVMMDIAELLDVPDKDKNLILKYFPSNFYLPMQLAIDKEPELINLKQKSNKLRKLFNITMCLDRLFSSRTIHNKSIVIGRKKLSDLIPLYWDTKTKTISTQYESFYLFENIGL
ncbi:MAG: PHP domain-containing protein [Spirochaetia bacterium]|jgi:DNA polymerase III alpha subunit|nr:PHP domain-containing protein [Spirochaetia bacterium]